MSETGIIRAAPACPDCGSAQTTLYQFAEDDWTLYCDECKREEPVRDFKTTLDVAPSPDIAALETAAESLLRLGDAKNAVALWAMALRLRMEIGHAP